MNGFVLLLLLDHYCNSFRIQEYGKFYLTADARQDFAICVDNTSVKDIFNYEHLLEYSK